MQCETQSVIAGFEDGWGPGAKEHGWPPEAGKSNETDASLAPSEGRQLCQTLILAQWTSDVQNCKLTNFHCFKP